MSTDRWERHDEVTDPAAETERAIGLGAQLASYQPQEDVRGAARPGRRPVLPVCRHREPEGGQPMRQIHVESPVDMAGSGGAAVWCFDLDRWGVCEQAATPEEAVDVWRQRHGPATIAERLTGDEQAFARDFRPADDAELDHTLRILAEQRARTMRVLDEVPDALLDRDDPNRVLPGWARWRTIRDMLWHICDTECRYYLPQSGLPARDRRHRLADELQDSHRHVRSALLAMPRDTIHRAGGETWTATKLLRRLAWHERGELTAIDTLLAGWRADGGG